jgi:UDP-GlcNAc3NAcA epimerase
VIIDDTTEWTETIEDGWNIIAGADKNKIIKYVNKAVKPKRHREVYGNGKSAQKIIRILNNYLSENQG